MKHRTARSKPNKRTIVLAVSLLLACLLIAAPVAYAMFTNSQHAQRTIAAYDAVGERFSSNYLAAVLNSGANVKTLYVTSAEHQPTAIMTVCNYDQGKQNRANAGDITYAMTARLVRKVDSNYVPADASYISGAGLTACTVTISDGDTTVTLGNTTVSTSAFSGSLAGGSAHSDTFTIRFSTHFASMTPPNLYLEVEVTPTPNTLPTLRGIFATGLRATGATNSWTGSFTDSTANAPSAYDGYNYAIEGVGSGTFILKWNNAKVTLSDESIRMLQSIASLHYSYAVAGTVSTVTIDVDSDDASRFDLQFYRKNVTAETWETDMNAALATGEAALTTVVGYHFT